MKLIRNIENIMKDKRGCEQYCATKINLQNVPIRYNNFEQRKSYCV